MKSAHPVQALALFLLVASAYACNTAQAQPPPPPPPSPRGAPPPPPPAKATAPSVKAPAVAAKAPAVAVKPASTPAKAAPDDAPKQAEPPQTWSDPRVVAQLVEDCRFDPDALTGDEKEKWQGLPDGDGPQIPGMTCDYSLGQACDGDACYDGPDGAIKCNEGCTTGCRSCGKTCALQCHKCKSTCTDHACRVACAQGCAICHETCTRERDRCSTGACKQNYKACWAALAAIWRNNGCEKRCAKFAGCVEGCMKRGSEQEACDKRCMPKDANGCDLYRFCQRGDYMVSPPTDP
jgi:hypothetical protein